MKKLIALIFICLCLLTVSCGNEARKKLAFEVETFNRDCPQQLGSTLLRSIVYEKSDNRVVMTYVIDEDYVDVSTLAEAGEEQRRYLRAFLRDAGSFLDDLVAADASFAIQFEGNISKASQTVELTADELKALDAETVAEDNDRAQLEGLVALTNRQAPYEIIDGVTFTSLALADSSMDYYYSYDPSKVIIVPDSLESMRQLAMQELRTEFKAPESEHQYDIICKLGLSVRFFYTPADTTADEYVLTISADEIAAF